AAVVFCLYWQTRHRMLVLVLLGFVVAAAFSVVSESRWDFWSARMESIRSYEEDPSFQGRLIQWDYAIKLANERLTGGGFASDLLARRYDGGTREPRAYHSNYFQMLGDHGWPGLVLYVVALVSTWRLGGRVIELTRDHPELSWANMLAAMIRASMVGYVVGGLVIAHAYYEPFYVLVSMLTVLKGLALGELSKERTAGAESLALARPVSIFARVKVHHVDPSKIRF
ncbi:MAG TPA: O-antigen ligase family protein, partial [Geminicoccaceae bacterium]